MQQVSNNCRGMWVKTTNDVQSRENEKSARNPPPINSEGVRRSEVSERLIFSVVAVSLILRISSCVEAVICLIASAS